MEIVVNEELKAYIDPLPGARNLVPSLRAVRFEALVCGLYSFNPE